MQIKHLLPLVLFFFISSHSIFAQQPISTGICGYTGKSSWLEWYQQHRNEFTHERGVDTTWLYVPMTLHIVGSDEGTGYYKLEQALRAVCEMNEQYEQAHIRYYLVPGDAVRYHANSSWYEHEFFPGGDEMINENRLDARVNAFLVADPAGNCGYSWQDAIVLGNNCSGIGNTTWAHEAGHHLSLPHPFSGWEGFDWNYSEPAPNEIDDHEVEKTDSSNCYQAGDGFCDTRPDYLNYRWGCDNNKLSNTTQYDPNGVAFRSDATIIMGYAFDQCADRFSPEQIEAMRANLNTQHADYLQITEPLQGIDSGSIVQLISPLDTQNVQYNNITLNWNLVPGATLYNVEVGLAPGFIPKFFNKTFYSNTTSVTITSGIPNNRVLIWRVRAYSEWDVCQAGDSVQIGVFKTKNLSATNDLEQIVAAELSPNPVAGGLPAVLRVTSDENLEGVLSVTDASGRLCTTQDIYLSAGENNVEIATQGLSAGFYVVTLRNEKGTLVKRLAVTD